jgi:hypothetical protein
MADRCLCHPLIRRARAATIKLMAKPTGVARTRRRKPATKAKRDFLERILNAPDRGTVV